MRLLHLADLHLGWEPSYLYGEKNIIRVKERNAALEKAVNFAIVPSNKIDAVIIVGDLFENFNPDRLLVRQVIYQLDRLINAGIFLLTVPGNHDEITYRDSVYREYGNNWPGHLVSNPMPELVVKQEIKGVMTNIYSLAYTGGLTKPAAIDSFPRENNPGLHIGAFHGSLDWEGLSDRSLPLRSSQFTKADYDYVALGHFHAYSEKKIGDGLALYPGAPDFKSFNDPGVGHLTIVDFSGNTAKVYKEKINVRPHAFINLELEFYGNFAELIAACKKLSDPESMILFSLNGASLFPFDCKDIICELENDFFYLQIENNSQVFLEKFLDNIAEELTVRGAFVRRLREQERENMSDRDRKVLQHALLSGLSALGGSDLK